MARREAERRAVAPTLPPIARPPRRVPFTLKTEMIFGGLAAFAWSFLAIGSSIAIIALRYSDLSSWMLFREGVVSVPGVVLGCGKTGSSEGSKNHKTPIYENRYRFTSGDDTYAGASYATGDCRSRGAAVVIEHVLGRPEISRIAGMRRARFGMDLAVVLVFPIVGVPLVGYSLRRGLRHLRLLKHGKLALGKLVGAEGTNVTINEQQVKKMRFAITTDTGARHEVTVKTHLTAALEDEPLERILYDPARPTVALAWDILLGDPRLDRTGALVPAGTRSLVLLVPPALAIAGLALAFWL